MCQTRLGNVLDTKSAQAYFSLGRCAFFQTCKPLGYETCTKFYHPWERALLLLCQLFNHIIGCLVSWYIQAHLNTLQIFDCKVVVFTYFSISLPAAEHSSSATQPPVRHGYSSESLETWLLSSPLQASQYSAPCLPPAQPPLRLQP